MDSDTPSNKTHADRPEGSAPARPAYFGLFSPRQWRGFAAVAGFLLIAGCASRTHHEWLVLFFDGVPPESGYATNAVASQSASGITAVTNPASSHPQPPAPIVHAPYAERECNACHESAFSQKMRGKTKEICLGCHTDLMDKAKSKHSPADEGECMTCHSPHESPRKFLLTKVPTALCVDCHDEMSAVKHPHAPVKEGECLECHRPHVSDQPHLLARKGTALCTSCHDGLAKGKYPHAPAENGECAACHKPHGSDLPHMMARKGGELCTSCHDKFTAKFLHAPAEGGECLECHRPHASSEPALVKKSIKTLCFDCHDQDEMKGKAAHAAAGQAACTLCHDPHGTDRKFMLKTTNSLPAAAPTNVP